MLFSYFKTTNFIPDNYYKSIYDINYKSLYAQGVRLILTDLDNTIIAYDQHDKDEKIESWLNELKDIGFEVIIVSNSRKKQRVHGFAKQLGIPCVNAAYKPFKFRMKKAMRLADKKYSRKQMVMMGDQLMTDIFVSKRLKIKCFLIEAVKRKSDIGPTRFNRKLESRKIKKIKNKYPHHYKHKMNYYK